MYESAIMKPITLFANLKISFKMGTKKRAMKKMSHVQHSEMGRQPEEVEGDTQNSIGNCHCC